MSNTRHGTASIAKNTSNASSYLQQIFKKAGIEVTNENKREIDRVIHSIVGVDYKNCPAAWKEVKKRITEDEESFISKLKEVWNKRI